MEERVNWERTNGKRSEFKKTRLLMFLSLRGVSNLARRGNTSKISPEEGISKKIRSSDRAFQIMRLCWVSRRENEARTVHSATDRELIGT